MKTVPCNLCGSINNRLLYPSTLVDNDLLEKAADCACTNDGYGRHYTIVQCRHCGLVYSSPRHNEEDVIKSYEAVEDPLYFKEREGRVLTFERHLRRMEELTGPGGGRQLLDVGCYTGVFVEVAAQRGWDAWGLEPSAWAIEIGRARGLKIVQGTLGSMNLPFGAFDVVTMWDVIEHLYDPMVDLQRVCELIRPGGWIVIHTMDIDSLLARVMGARWPWLMQMHLYYFSRQTMATMLEEVGFKAICSGAQGRYVSLGYLGTRLHALLPGFGSIMGAILKRRYLQQVPVPINLGDLFTVYARKLASQNSAANWKQ